jgi:hypothetical protein
MVESTVGALSQMMAPATNTQRTRATKEKAAPAPAAGEEEEEEKKAPPKKRAKKEKVTESSESKKKKRAPKPTKTAAPVERSLAPPAMATLDRMWQRKDGPPPFKYDDRCYWMWSHMSANVILWALRIGNKDQVRRPPPSCNAPPPPPPLC